MNTKTVLLAVAVIGIAAMLVAGASAMYGSGGEDFGGKGFGFAKMNPAVLDCLKDARDECKAGIDFNATGARKEMRDCMNGSFKDCRKDLNLTCNLSGMRVGMRNCLNDTISECRASIDFNATGAGREMWNCTKDAFKDCRQDLNLTGNAGCSFLAMKKMQNNIKLNLKEKIKRNAIKNRWFGQ
jgi:hypothetical protein